MAELLSTKKTNIYTAEGKECPTPSIETMDTSVTGDATLISATDSTELLQYKLDAENLINNLDSLVPATPADVTNVTIAKYFGKGWNGSFPNCTTIVSRKKSTFATEFAYYYSLADYLMRSLGFGSISELVNSACPQIGVIYSHWNRLSADWASISSCISNFKDFKFCTASPMEMINSIDVGLQNLENLILSADGAIDDIISAADDIMGMFLGKDGESITSKVSDFIDNFGDKLSKAGEAFLDKMSNLPESVMNAFMNCQFIQNLFSMPQRIINHLASTFLILSSIRSPTCLKDFAYIIRTLREAVAEIKNVANVIQEGIAQVNNIKAMIQQGNWIGLIGQLNSGQGMKAQMFNIVEHPSSFAAKYPANSAYTTHGGHIVEMDNTKGHERIHVQHKAGTSVEMSPEGDMHSKVKKDFQLMVDGNIEINSNKKVTITGKDGVKIDYGGTNFEMDKSNVGMGGPNGKMVVDDFVVTSQRSRVMSTENLTLGSVLETSVSAFGLLSLSSNVAIKMQAPSISIIAESPAGIQFLSASGTIIGIGNGVGIASTINTVIVAAKSGMYGAGGANIIGAGVNMIGGLG